MKSHKQKREERTGQRKEDNDWEFSKLKDMKPQNQEAQRKPKRHSIFKSKDTLYSKSEKILKRWKKKKEHLIYRESKN